MSVVPFGARLAAAMDEHGPLCVGIDPHASLLEAWGLPDSPAGLREFSSRVLEAVGGRVAAVKPQAAFFERHGSAGLAVLEEVVAAARETGTLSIVDAKRGDIGSTMGAYAEAFLRDGSPLAGDALTVSPFLGFGSLAPAVELATATGRGLFVLCLTSNPEGASVQHARRGAGAGTTSVAASIAASAGELNAGAEPFGSVGLVVGATIGTAAQGTGTDLVGVNGPLLAPGVGAQGAGPDELRAVFGDARRTVLASSSRGVLRAGPEVGALRAAALEAAGEAARALRG
ncbi:orotidine-5'-phosphate decarboxylase [Sanguibacter massiliensis]|uniref:orotidine-5'-phosphate decarboxylase n=1 Tax=Sanguibacter massiliensis TaxID=1973217 RepID=UPI00241430B2|nr:orotidine-5'-phosphate decarboxylase [Sanguibacter massiliensis]